MYKIISPHNQLQRKRQKIFHNYSHKSIDNFKLIVANLPPTLIDQENLGIVT